MPEERVRELATGEIFTAEQANEHGLIDELGDLDDAIDLAQSLAGLAERKVTYVRPHRSLRERLLSNTAASVLGDGGGVAGVTAAGPADRVPVAAHPQICIDCADADRREQALGAVRDRPGEPALHGARSRASSDRWPDRSYLN